MKVKEQLALQYQKDQPISKESYLDKLTYSLQSDLDFHSQRSNYSSHNLHSFPAKFPPQLPHRFITELTKPHDIVLDPMVGSGTTVVEAFLANRKGIGFDIDPLAIQLATVKTANLNQKKLVDYAQSIYYNAKTSVDNRAESIEKKLNHFSPRTKEFIDYWFILDVQRELIALLNEITKIQDDQIKTFFQVLFSSIIITKTGGVSLALDLAHTRPHKAKIVFDKNGKLLYGNEHLGQNKRTDYLTKALKSPLEEFEKKFHQNLHSLADYNHPERIQPEIKYCDSQKLCLDDSSVDLIVTSPPYASNAIDYMRAHKFSLVWFGYEIEKLTLKRKEYIGGEFTSNFSFEDMPNFLKEKIIAISRIDGKRGNVLKRYFSEMTRALSEMYRVLKPGKAAIVVVGNSMMRGIDTETNKCLAEIGENIGFIVPYIGVRKLDRNKRMLPAGMKTDFKSQIQQRMHEEYVIGFYKS